MVATLMKFARRGEGGSELQREVVRILSWLERGLRIDLAFPDLDTDILLVCEWLLKLASNRFPDLEMQLAAQHVDTARLRLERATSTRNERKIALPAPRGPDLIEVLLSLRRELIHHHGLLIPEKTLLRAFELARQNPRPYQGPLSQTLDLLDESILAYRRSLLVLARSRQDSTRIEEAFANLAQALEKALEPAPDAPTSEPGPRLTTVVKRFGSVVRSLGGQNRAAVVSPAFLDYFVTFR